MLAVSYCIITNTYVIIIYCIGIHLRNSLQERYAHILQLNIWNYYSLCFTRFVYDHSSILPHQSQLWLMSIFMVIQETICLQCCLVIHHFPTMCAAIHPCRCHNSISYIVYFYSLCCSIFIPRTHEAPRISYRNLSICMQHLKNYVLFYSTNSPTPFLSVNTLLQDAYLFLYLYSQLSSWKVFIIDAFKVNT